MRSQTYTSWYGNVIMYSVKGLSVQILSKLQYILYYCNCVVHLNHIKVSSSTLLWVRSWGALWTVWSWWRARWDMESALLRGRYCTPCLRKRSRFPIIFVYMYTCTWEVWYCSKHITIVLEVIEPSFLILSGQSSGWWSLCICHRSYYNRSPSSGG